MRGGVMTEQEYQKRLMSIRNESRKQECELAVEYAMSNNPYKVGDIIQDRIGRLRIEKIEVKRMFYGYPYCIYFGVELKKDGTPHKRQTRRYIVQGDIKK